MGEDLHQRMNYRPFDKPLNKWIRINAENTKIVRNSDQHINLNLKQTIEQNQYSINI